MRPLLFASEVGLELRPADAYRFVAMAFVAGSFFAPTAPSVAVWASRSHARAMPDGTGAAKCAGNYAATFAAQAVAEDHGCQQVLWLDSRERRWIEELGGMNVFYVRGGRGPRAEVATPPLTGTLLPGVTRDALLTLAGDLGHETAEAPLTLDALCLGCASGEITEVFACGTAAVVTAVSAIRTESASWAVGSGHPGPVTAQLRRTLVDIHHGRAPDPHGWLLEVPTDS